MNLNFLFGNSMTSKNGFTLPLIVFCFFSIQINAQNIFQTKYYLADSIYYSTVKTIENSPGTYLNMFINGTISSPFSQIHLTRINSSGNLQSYKRHYYSVPGSIFSDYKLLPGGNMAICGQSSGMSGSLLLFDSSGSFLSGKIYTGGLSINLLSVTHTGNHHLLLSGGQNQPSNAVIIETDTSGNLLNESEFTINTHATTFRCGIELNNRERLFVGIVYSPTNSMYRTQIALLKTDSTGNPVWGLQCGDPAITFSPQNVFELSDGSIIVTGTMTPQGTPYPSAFIAKFSSGGHSLWVRKVVTPNTFYYKDACLKHNDEIAMTGFFMPSSGNEFAVIHISDSTGNLTSTKIISEQNYGLDGAAINSCSDGGLFIAASTPVGNGYYYRYLLKTDSLLNISCNAADITFSQAPVPVYDSLGYAMTSSAISVSNIPSSDLTETLPAPIEASVCDPNTIADLSFQQNKFSISLSENTLILFLQDTNFETAVVSVLDISGRIILEQAINTAKRNEEFRIGLPTLPGGMYLVRLRSESKFAAEKLFIGKN